LDIFEEKNGEEENGQKEKKIFGFYQLPVRLVLSRRKRLGSIGHKTFIALLRRCFPWIIYEMVRSCLSHS